MKGFDSASLPHPKIPASAIPPEWPAMIREIIQREGRQPVRGPLDRAVIQIKSMHDNTWCDLMLPGNGFEFTTVEERDLVIAQIGVR